MTTRINEKELLDKLDIPDWRHMTKDKVITFASSMAYLDPEVAKKAIEQFPQFVKLGTELVSTLKDSLNSAYSESSKGMDNAYAINMRILESLDSRLNKLFISRRERERIIDAMLEVSKNISELEDTRHQFLSNGIKTVGKVVAGVCLVAGAAIGVVIKKQ